MRMWTTSFLIILVALSMVGAGSAAPSRSLVINWQEGTIRFDHNKMMSLRKTNDKAMARYPVVDCLFVDMKTKCWKLRPERKSGKDYAEPYGTNLRFVRPIAVLPYMYGLDNSTNADAEKESLDTDARNPKYVAGLKEVVVHELSASEIADVLETAVILGIETESHSFSEVESTIGGQYALELWQGQIGKLPTRQCINVEDYCAVVVSGKHNGNDAIAYCLIMNSSIGIGIPFNCKVVAYREKGKWLVLSYDSPQQCDGCGAASGADCNFETDRNPNEVAAVLIAAMKEGRTNIQLKEISRDTERISLAGRNIATNSKFYTGYYDKSYAIYHVYKPDDGSAGHIIIEGLFNLLISAEPSNRGLDYREIGNGKDESDLEWFQGEVLKIIKRAAANKLGAKGDCEVQPIY